MKLILINLILLIHFRVYADVVFEKKQIRLDKHILTVEIADSPQKQAQGLMNRKSLNKNSGMLFIFPNESIRSFWMKNTLMDLSIGFFNKDKKLVSTFEMKVPSLLEKSPPSYSSEKLAMYALEMPAGWFKKNKIPVGVKFEFVEKP